ncbi:MAG: cadmium-translocating P-type ATPase [Clostridia bacterium]|nr:cadmium-translocating P-type ATPase [Clostridia bacterium]
MTRKQKKMLIRIVIATAMLTVVALLPTDGWLRFSLFLFPYLCIGYDILIKAGKGIWNRQPFDENFLMAIATVGAITLGEYAEGVFVMLFYQVGELFQSVAVGKSRRSIGALMDIRPDIANLESDGGILTEVDPCDVPVGSVIVVRPGERIPIDGCVIEGSSSLDTAALTGESLPRDVATGDTVISGCINLSGALRIRTERAFEDSTVSRILNMVENAGARKSRSEKFITRFARIYTPVVCASALALGLLPPVFRMLVLQTAPMWGDWIYRALTFLVISCPCALVISIPLGFFAGIGGASRAGVLVKGSNYLELLSQVQVVAFDKTGTLTEGRFWVTEVNPIGMSRERLLEYAALAEGFSTHPIADSLMRALGSSPDLSRVCDVTEIGGHGIKAMVDGDAVAIGNARMLRDEGIAFAECDAHGTVVYVAVNGVYAGFILIADRIKATAKQTVADLRRIGIRRTVMLTGDAHAIGEAVARELGIDEVRCELLPQDKLSVVEQMLEASPRERLAFVGDGINDSPVLSRADVGIAMGALGSDAAIEAADVVLMDDDPQKIVCAIGIAKKCMRIVRQNIVFALGVKLLCLCLGALGLANMWLAVFADVGVMVLAVLNAIRALYAGK